MLESISSFIIENAQNAHYVIFGLLMLAGFCVPISEDLMIILSAVIAATLVPENTLLLFGAVFLGSYLSDWIAYGIGRFGGQRLLKNRWFSKHVSFERLEKIQSFYSRYGFLTLLVGRFIPFGVRNALFITAGLGNMPFTRFIIADGIACIISNSALFYLAYTLGQNYELLLGPLKWVNLAIFTVFALTVIGFIWYKRRTKAENSAPEK